MDKKTVSEALRALACDDQKRSKASRLREVAEDVEAVLQAGVTRSAVVEELARHGLVMTLPTFETTLRRIRQKQQLQAAVSKRPIPLRAEPAKPNDIGSHASHNPTDIDRIMNSTPDLDALARIAKRNKGARK